MVAAAAAALSQQMRRYLTSGSVGGDIMAAAAVSWRRRQMQRYHSRCGGIIEVAVVEAVSWRQWRYNGSFLYNHDVVCPLTCVLLTAWVGLAGFVSCWVRVWFPIFDQVLALVGTLVPQYYLAFAAGAAVEVDSGTISLCVECSGMMALCLCCGSYLVFLSYYDRVILKISTAPSSFELLEYGNGPCEPVQD